MESESGLKISLVMAVAGIIPYTFMKHMKHLNVTEQPHKDTKTSNITRACLNQK